jgi:hypothetical protein
LKYSDPVQMPFADNEHPVGAFGADGAAEPLGDRVHEWGPHVAKHCADAASAGRRRRWQ